MMKKGKRKYVEYNYEATYIEDIDHATDSKIERLLKQGKIKSVYTTKTIKAGKQFEVEIYPSFTKKQITGAGVKKNNYQAQKNLNDKNARKKLERLIHANFKENDLYLTFTYDNKHLPASIEEAKKKMKNYIDRINYRRKKLGMGNAKYIYITEYSNKRKIRCHHHLIMDGAMSMDDVEKAWKCGRTSASRIKPDGDGTLSALATYLSKDPAGSKRWCSSLNLKKPYESKSYTAFRACHIRKMVEARHRVKEMLEKKYCNKKLIFEEIRYNEVNDYVYIYAKMSERCNQ